MKSSIHRTTEELENQIEYYEYRLQDFIISEEEREFAQERLRELKSEKHQAI